MCTCILVIYTSQERASKFFSNVTHEANSERNCLLYVRIKKETIHYKKCVCVSHKKRKFVIICHCDPIPPTSIPSVSQEEMSYFGPGKGLNYFI